ncbi:MAG TPA: tetratricopeptide repeat protein [Paraburkholderia sp.]|jgi:tetratricopeptide (TPR) repeat protein|nr:tetratricopeptide repeat protein [Paraburkholderia sp.]
MKPSSGRAAKASTRAATLAATALAGVALALGTAFSAHAAPPASADQTPGADAAIAQHNWTAALTELDTRIQSNPRDVQAKFKRATVLARLGRDDDAIAAFRELTQQYPELPEPYNNLAALLAKQGRLDEARVALETATRANPSYALAFENLGDLYLRLADASYRRALALGHASGATQQRLDDLQKIVAPSAANARPAPTSAAPTQTESVMNRSSSDLVNSPLFQFGGPGGSLAMPPYMAPSR